MAAILMPARAVRHPVSVGVRRVRFSQIMRPAMHQPTRLAHQQRERGKAGSEPGRE